MTKRKRDKIFRRVVWEMENNKLFLDSSISLEGVSRIVSENRTAVSEALGSNGVTFRALVNQYRTQYAIDLLLRSDQQSLPLEEIAEMSGFVSVRKMNSFIRQSSGVTAGALRERVFGKS